MGTLILTFIGYTLLIIMSFAVGAIGVKWTIESAREGHRLLPVVFALTSAMNFAWAVDHTTDLIALTKRVNAQTASLITTDVSVTR